MAQNPEILLFTFTGHCDLQVPHNNDAVRSPIAEPAAAPPATSAGPAQGVASNQAVTGAHPVPTEHDVVNELNAKADNIAEELEREIQRRMSRLGVSVQAEIHFEEGSVLVTATVALLMWGGSVVASAAKEEAAKQLGALVRMAVQRTINRALRATSAAQYLTPLKVDEALVVDAPQDSNVDVSATSMRSPPESDFAMQGQGYKGTGTDQRLQKWTFAAILALLALNLVMLLDRWIVITVRRPLKCAV